MTTNTEERMSGITALLNATISSIKNVVPVSSQIEKPQRLKQDFYLNFGVLIGIAGDVNGKLVFSADLSTFASIGEQMYGMPLEGEMLQSFSAELANMIAGGISTDISTRKIELIITTPTVLQGNTKLSGYKQALELPVIFEQMGNMNTYLLLD